jgi:hypothetical protein
VKKLVEKWGLSIIKRLIELILWDIAQFLVDFCMNFVCVNEDSKSFSLTEVINCHREEQSDAAISFD